MTLDSRLVSAGLTGELNERSNGGSSALVVVAMMMTATAMVMVMKWSLVDYDAETERMSNQARERVARTWERIAKEFRGARVWILLLLLQAFMACK